MNQNWESESKLLYLSADFLKLGYNCFTVLHNKMNQLYVYIHPFLPGCPCPPPPCPLGCHRAELPLLYGRFPLAIYFTLCHPNLQSPFHSTLSPAHIYSLCLSLYSCPANRYHLYHFFWIPHICINTWYLFFSFNIQKCEGNSMREKTVFSTNGGETLAIHIQKK